MSLTGASTWTPTTWAIWQSKMAPVVAHPMFPSLTPPLSRCSSCCGAQESPATRMNKFESKGENKIKWDLTNGIKDIVGGLL